MDRGGKPDSSGAALRRFVVGNLSKPGPIQQHQLSNESSTLLDLHLQPAIKRSHTACLFALGVLVLTGIHPQAESAEPKQKLPLRTFFVTRSLDHDRLLSYLKTARPQIVQIGNYGAMFHGYADDERSTGWPMQLPVAGERAALDFQRKLNDKVHDMGLTVVGHFRLVKVMGHWKEQSGFVEYYNRRWPKELLGPKPHPELIELLQRDAQGKPIQLGRSGHSQLALCLSSPHARKMFKQMLKVAVDHEVDGVVTNFNYHFGCVCPYCQDAFKQWLKSRLSPQELQTKLAVKNLQQHFFREIPVRIPGYPAPEEATDLDWLAMRWGAEHFKRMFDEIFVDYGRSLKKDLLVAQWNHLGHVSHSEERTFLPLKMWGRGEDYFWYSGGAAFVGRNLNLSEGKAGDAWLSCLYVREMSGGKPFVMGKYDRARMAVSMAEGFASGGMGMGRYMRFEDPVGFEVLGRYTNFMHAHRGFYDKAVPYADAALVLPRQSVINRHPESLDQFRLLGQALVERQLLIDVVADEKLTFQRLSQYPAVILQSALALSDEQLRAIQHNAADGGKLMVRGETAVMNEVGQPRPRPALSNAKVIEAESPTDAADEIVALLRAGGASTIESPWTVRANAYVQPNRVLLHLVNYDREEGAPETNRTGPATERPQRVRNITVDMRLPNGHRAMKVSLHTPNGKHQTDLKFRRQANRVSFTIPQILVYGVVAIDVGQ